MIILKDGYGIDTYDHGYEVGAISETVDKKTGKTKQIIAKASYFTYLSDAIDYAYRDILHTKLEGKRKDIDIEGLIETIKQTNKEFEKMLEPLKKLEKPERKNYEAEV